MIPDSCDGALAPDEVEAVLEDSCSVTEDFGNNPDEDSAVGMDFGLNGPG